MTRGRVALLLLALALSWTGCGPRGDPAAAERVLLLAGNLFASGDRCARVLDELAAASDVLGPVHFQVLARPGASPDELADALEQAPDARAVVVVVGDLSLLPGVDPNEPFPPAQMITSRRIDRQALERALERLESLARSRGMAYVLATHPLGRQGRIEVPQLVEIAAILRQHGARLDLAAAFAEREQQLLFVNDIDELDEYGHDALAEALFRSLLDERPPWPPRDEAEAAARHASAALLAWAAGEEGRFRREAAAALAGKPADPRAATRQAALANLLRGLVPATRRRWLDIQPQTPGDVPALALGRLLALGTPALQAADPYERRLIGILTSLRQGDSSPLAAAEELVSAWPARPSAWFDLVLAERLTRNRRGVPRLAQRHLQTYTSTSLSADRWQQLLGQWPECLAALPALLLLENLDAPRLPAGPALHEARRASRLGLQHRAVTVLQRATARLRLPPNWVAERQRLATLAGE